MRSSAIQAQGSRERDRESLGLSSPSLLRRDEFVLKLVSNAKRHTGKCLRRVVACKYNAGDQTTEVCVLQRLLRLLAFLGKPDRHCTYTNRVQSINMAKVELDESKTQIMLTCYDLRTVQAHNPSMTVFPRCLLCNDGLWPKGPERETRNFAIFVKH